MADWKETLGAIAPTVASALLGPLGGAAIATIGGILGVEHPTPDTIANAINSGKMTPDQLSEIRKLEMQYQAEERERGFRYAELAFKDRDSARQANVTGNTQRPLFWLSLLLLCVALGAEVAVLFMGYPSNVPDMIVGRVLGLMDAVAMMILSYWYGTSAGSAQKTQLLAQADAVK